jgi:hypothetical protein
MTLRAVNDDWSVPRFPGDPDAHLGLAPGDSEACLKSFARKMRVLIPETRQAGRLS